MNLRKILINRNINATLRVLKSEASTFIAAQIRQIAIHEASHTAFLIKNKNYATYDYTKLNEPRSRQFRAGIYGETCFDPAKAYGYPIIEHNQFFINFHLIGKLGEYKLGNSLSNFLKVSATDDLNCIHESLAEIRHNKMKVFFDKSELDTIKQITSNEIDALNDNLVNLGNFIDENSKLIKILAIMLTLNQKIDISDIWDIYLHDIIEFPQEFLLKNGSDNIELTESELFTKQNDSQLIDLKFNELFQHEEELLSQMKNENNFELIL